MQVWEQDSFGQIAFDAASLRQGALGHIVENRLISSRCWKPSAAQAISSC